MDGLEVLPSVLRVLHGGLPEAEEYSDVLLVEFAPQTAMSEANPERGQDEG